MSFVTERVNNVRCAGCQLKINVSQREIFSIFRCPECDHPVRVPVRAGDYVILRQIGSGSYSRVYLGYGRLMMRLSAIKVLQPDSYGEGLIDEALATEAQAMARIEHENVVAIHGVDFHRGVPMVIMEYVDNGALSEQLRGHGKLGEIATLRYAIGAAKGLQAAAERGIVHRDIKPGNILLTSRGVVKVTDFGLSCHRATRATDVVGTPYYVSPEVVVKTRIDHRADIYSLGCMLYHLLTGKYPFTGSTIGEACRARLKTPAPRIRASDPRLGVATDDMVTRMLRRDPDDRYQSYGHLLTDMAVALAAAEGSNERFTLEPESALDRAETRKARSVRRSGEATFKL